MDIKNMKMVIGLVVAIVGQAFGMIWYIAQLDSTVNNNTIAIESERDTRHTTLDDLDIRLSEIEEAIEELKRVNGLLENEMRTIMSDHSNFGDILKDMGKSGYGDNRQYGNYSGQ